MHKKHRVGKVRKTNVESTKVNRVNGNIRIKVDTVNSPSTLQKSEEWFEKIDLNKDMLVRLCRFMSSVVESFITNSDEMIIVN